MQAIFLSPRQIQAQIKKLDTQIGTLTEKSKLLRASAALSCREQITELRRQQQVLRARLNQPQVAKLPVKKSTKKSALETKQKAARSRYKKPRQKITASKERFIWGGRVIS